MYIMITRENNIYTYSKKKKFEITLIGSDSMTQETSSPGDATVFISNPQPPA